MTSEQADTVSVIIPTYNAAGSLRAAISHALSQTHAVHEIFVCDDGSTDESEEAVRSFSDPRVQWIPCGRNHGPGKPRNMGAALASGDWLCFLDSDDYWLPNKLETQLRACVQAGTKMVSANALISRNGTRTAHPLLSKQPHRITFSDLLRENVLICSNVMVRRKVWMATEGFPEEVALGAVADYACWLQCLMHTDASVINHPLMVYNDNPAASIRSKGVQTLRGQRELVFGHVLGALERKGLSQDARYTLLRRHWSRASAKHTGLLGALKEVFARSWG
jgi:teichuronic acid biosynthesis glycosyltransferase TuaG